MLSFKDMARLNALERAIADLEIRIEALEVVAAQPAAEPVKRGPGRPPEERRVTERIVLSMFAAVLLEAIVLGYKAGLHVVIGRYF